MKIITLIFEFALTCFALQAKPIKVMVLTGHDDKYHNWQIKATYIPAILRQYGNFDTDIVKMHDSSSEDSNFAPEFTKYKVIVLAINDVKWSEKTKLAFENYVRNGGGVVVVHEANNAFPEWKEFNAMIGLGGWAGRNEKSGPYYYWKDGKSVLDYSPGEGGSHGAPVPFVVNVRDSDHPITRGLPTKWLHKSDELYGNLRGPAKNMQVLATAFSTKETGGTGKEEPVLFTIAYGKGRIFQTVMGHATAELTESLEDVGFQVTL
ncbi:MAG: ThuA domain-containing protein, partial [Paludibacter sp.]|nr:ThuA domain-containing protein [Paludibacter sp.]